MVMMPSRIFPLPLRIACMHMAAIKPSNAIIPIAKVVRNNRIDFSLFLDRIANIKSASKKVINPIITAEIYSYPHKHFINIDINARTYEIHLALSSLIFNEQYKPTAIGINHVNSTQ